MQGVLALYRTEIVTMGLKVVAIVGLSLIISRILIYLVNKLLTRDSTFLKSDPRHLATLNSLLKSLIRYAVSFIAVISILDLFNIPTSSVLAGAGILGIALGFGAQNFVKDVITGFFVLYEDQYSVGDYVTIAGTSGIVEEIGLRVTKLRDFSGDLHTIPNGSIDVTTNHSRGNMRVMVDISINYDEDADKAIALLEKVCSEMRATNPSITDGPEVLGIQRLDESSVILRIIAMTLPMRQWEVERQILRNVKDTFDQAGVEFAYPHLVVIGDPPSDGSRRGSA